MAKREPEKVTNIKKYRRPLNINIGMIIFAVFLVYIIISVVLYFRQNAIVPYVVQEGYLYTDQVYTGIAIREETLVTANEAGYINYYAREGEKVAVGNLVYTIDETGRLAEYIGSDQTDENALSAKELSELKNEIVDFKHNFSSNNFVTTYDFKYTVKGQVIKLANSALTENIQNINKDKELAALVQFGRSQKSGIVEYWMDSYETLTSEAVTAACFDKNTYERKQLLNNELVAQGENIYKLCTSEEWSIVIPMEEQKAQELLEKEYVNVRFLKNQDEAWGRVEVLHNPDGTYVELHFTNSMITFAGERFLDVELVINESTGLKIPNTSIAQLEFFLVPENYITQSSTTNSYGVLREKVLENGTTTTEYVEVTIYNNKDGNYYVGMSALRTGDHIIAPDTQNVYTMSLRGTLIGVFNMNKGYADFRQIEILYQNDEYSIVKSNTKYGLNVYDLIVLDSSAVSEDQFVYE